MNRPTSGSPRLRRSFVAALIALFAIVSALAAPASAQDGQTDEERLLAREQTLQSRIAEAQQSLEDFATERSQVVIDINAATAEIESSGDALEQLALARREPSRVRVSVALERFVSGEPTQEALVSGLAATNNDPTPFQRQEVIASILEEAESQIAAIDGLSQELRDGLPSMESDRQVSENRLIVVDTTVDEIEVALAADQDELTVVDEALQWYRDSCLLYTSPSPRDLSTSRMPSSA